MHVEPIGYNKLETDNKLTKKEVPDKKVEVKGVDDNKDVIVEKEEKKESKVEKKRESTMHAQYGVHKETQSITIKIIDDDTNEVIRELPPEKNLDRLVSTMKKLKKIDKRV